MVDSLRIWVRGEVFDHGLLHTPSRASASWTSAQIFDFLGKLSLTSPSTSTCVTRQQWIQFIRDRSTGPLPLSDQEALAYWGVFSALTDTIMPMASGGGTGGESVSSFSPATSSSHKRSDVANATPLSEAGMAPSSPSGMSGSGIGIPTDCSAPFIDIRVLGVLLYLQTYTPSRYRAFNLKSEIDWPDKDRVSRSMDSLTAPGSQGQHPLNSPRSSASSPRAQITTKTYRRDNNHIVDFVRNNTEPLLQLVSRCYGKDQALDEIACDDLNQLAILIATGERPLGSALLEGQGGGSSPTDALPIQHIKKLIRERLVWNWEEYPSLTGPDKATSLSSSSLAKAIRAGGSMIVGVSKACIIREQSELNGADSVHIFQCTDCTIYITARVRFVYVGSCEGCQLVLCAVSSLCSINNSERLQVHTIAKAIKLENVTDTTLYCYCRLRPILTGDTRAIELAPSNIVYSRLDTLLEGSTLRYDEECVDLFAHPICCAPNLANTHASLNQPQLSRTLHAHALRAGLHGHGAGSGGGPEPTSPDALSQTFPPRLLGDLGRSASVVDGDEDAGLTYRLVHPDKFQALVVPDRRCSPGRRPASQPQSPTHVPPTAAAAAASPPAAAAAAAAGAPTSSALPRSPTPTSGTASSSSKERERDEGGPGGGGGIGVGVSSRQRLVLPEVYAAALQQRIETVKELQESIGQLPEGPRQALNKYIQGHFRDWLQKTGRQKHIMDLMKMVDSDASGRQAGVSPQSSGSINPPPLSLTPPPLSSANGSASPPQPLSDDGSPLAVRRL
ncbi:unnamed protein product [Vitrella brassicaformis CCMP3155]|uniref:TBCC domain-containing protein 1 n=3 Tax=Vitrella brassicaformis TaxID=1169539 RepID=A0A0G4ED42_VITBC|nr:unnamed protein product [Vitrella brassicaformis CCMP3155]|eukprot:CEL93262.1 unnamed protein product [Vitrella brassicaformis CCMP3155]